LFYEASKTGMPLQRSLAINHPHDHKIYDGQFYNQYLFGPSLLIAPVESSKEFVKVYLPEGDWYYLYNGKKYSGQSEIILECPVHKLPVFVKGGAIIPMQSQKSNTAETADTLFLHIYAGKELSSFTLYEDDGTTFGYEQGAYAKRVIESKPGMLVIHAQEGNFRSSLQKLKVIFHGLETESAHVSYSGQSLALHPEVNRFFAPLEKFDPIADPEPAPEENVYSVEIQYSAEQVILTW
jgi:alpha-glucosidase